MRYGKGMILILAACGIVLLIGVLRNKMEWLLNVFMRAILGTVAMYFINSALSSAGISLGVGINAVTVLTSGILGLPGLVALYGLGIYKLL
ncbi:MAG: pro-sigmaK processing inhibitor BofA family protein [Clostridium sp.]|nr:pro-sigmaK processing inhibitor BofA family protein [Acetatifactor muris]MCM1527789.1 pro-sigmaK processing inhibitor BofA family protein [Bacteroides sp.]MCM1563884.1 pro-sigmaK processing inhibitor BofA family protein [Clostridium sp.]